MGSGSGVVGDSVGDVGAVGVVGAVDGGVSWLLDRGGCSRLAGLAWSVICPGGVDWEGDGCGGSRVGGGVTGGVEGGVERAVML